MVEQSPWRHHPHLGVTEVGEMPAMHAVVVIADAYGEHTDSWGEDDVYCPACGWRAPVPPASSAWEVSNEHLLDVALPVLVAAGDLAEADVPAFRQRAPRYPGSLDALLADASDRRSPQQSVAHSATRERRRRPGEAPT